MLFRSNKLLYLVALSIAIAATSALQAEEKVLYLGGSHSLGSFGESLDSELRQSRLNVTTVVDGGAGPYHWLKSYQSFPCENGYWEKSSTTERRVSSIRTVPKIESLIEAYSPDYVVIQTEWNLYATLRSPRRLKSENILEVKFLINQMCKAIKNSGAKAYWILPPHSHEVRHSLQLQEELITLMIDVIEEYEFAYFDSSNVTRYTANYPENDGVTLSEHQYQSWSNKVAENLLPYIGVKPVIKNPIEIAKPIMLSDPKRNSAPQLNPLSDETSEQ